MVVIAMKKSIPFGKNLRRLLDQSGLKYNRAAEKIGISKNAIGQIMEGETNPSFDTIEKLITVLGLKPSDLFGVDSGEATSETLIGDMTAIQFEYYFDSAIKKIIDLKGSTDELTTKERYVINALRKFGDDRSYDTIGFLVTVGRERFKEIMEQMPFKDQDLKAAAVQLAHTEASARLNDSSAGKKPKDRVE